MLVEQLAHELKNFNLYKTFAVYFKIEGIDKMSEYFNKRADEEMLHHEWVLTYLTDADIKFEYPEIPSNNITIKTMLDPFVLTVDREIETTDLIYKIYEEAISEKDYMTKIWLERPLLLEQIEEENTSRAALRIMEEDSDIYEKAERILALLEE